MKKIRLSKYITPVFETPAGSWFGYYNYDVLSHDQTKMLSNRTSNDAVKVEKGMTIEVGYYDLKTREYHKVGVSDSYNWQQGAMLQWMPGDGNEDKVIFNTSDGKHNIAKIVDINTLEERIINWSIYGLTPDGKKSITLNFERSHWCRAYHYESVANENYDVRVAEDDGIFEIDLEKNLRKRIVSIQDVINIDKEEYFDSARHWLEHIMVSPSGRRFCFLHRFTIGSLDDYETRLFIADIDGKNLQIIDGWRDNYWSHFGWNGDDEFTIYGYKSNKHRQVLDCLKNNINLHNEKKFGNLSLRSCAKIVFHSFPLFFQNLIIRKIKGQLSSYQYYIKKGSFFKFTDMLDNQLFEIDGHPSFTKNGYYMITDTYPDYRCYRRLIIYNSISKKGIVVGKLKAGLYNKPGTCDLHPKLCRNNEYLVVDTAYDGRHHMIMFRINWELLKKRIK